MAFGIYLAALAERVERVVVFGRLDPDGTGCEHELGSDIEFVPLPFYSSVADLPAVYRSLPAAAKAFESAAGSLDCAWIFGPHPVSLRFLKIARRAGLPVALGVRQDQPTYMRTRLHGIRRAIGVPYFELLERRYRSLARELPTLVAGDELASLYGGPPTVRSTAFTLVDSSQLASGPVTGSSAGGRTELISVGRIDPEKNPLLLPKIVAELRRLRPATDWRLRIVGDGPLAAELEQEARRLGVAEQIELSGYVPFGPQLNELYAQSDLMLHVSHTEGLPQVLIEAMAAGLPMVATDVGGVAAAVAGTGTPLVPPNDAEAAAMAVAELAADAGDRRRCAELGLERAAQLTIEAQQAEALGHIAAHYGKPVR
jgi:glycosyltransferase involved in cell wall biosynthesis